MKLSLSVRVAEEFHSKETASLTLTELADLAVAAGYDALCMRASQIGIDSPRDAVEKAGELLQARGLTVSMVTGDFDIVYNNDRGPACLRNVEPYLQLARRLKAPMIRVALKTEDDIKWAQRAADDAANHGIRLVHQCHTQSLFETVEGIEATLRRIGRPNFGLIYEPANLELCGQDYGPKTIHRLGPWLFNVYLQNQVLRSDGKLSLNTWCRGPVSLDLIPVHAGRGINFETVFAGLATLGYRGPITVHQAGAPGESPREAATLAAAYLRQLAARTGL